ncbi:hypothetical protein J2R76_003486 [Bradyrhizobium sp. USDA 4532]|uniref:hypothetical protein n=1 Tax=unclassified Bradyrhizobium TaxID=2631580 RepID=UPI0020A10D01|nr:MULTISPECIES: hypothetical protein [unclassified Bradyrhizobium]MCP1835150.1 hypothetical protein [Bradyrhizobium sp. USDA 4545]MCP1919895.1 hypothetical protein [Bradyrhizobium sp. USDA 4532]
MLLLSERSPLIAAMSVYRIIAGALLGKNASRPRKTRFLAIGPSEERSLALIIAGYCKASEASAFDGVSKITASSSASP